MSTPNPLGRVVWGLLALVLAAAAWLGQSPDDELLAPRETRADRSGPTRDPASAPGPVPARTAPAAAPAKAAASASSEAWASPEWWQAQRTAWAQRAVLRDAPPPDSAAWGAWAPAPPAPEPRAADALAPQAPAFPHAWVGRVVDDAPRAVIAGPQRTWVLRVGEVLDGQWRLDTLGERQLGFTYLPLQQTVLVSARSSATP